jgi:hypothetical protein
MTVVGTVGPILTGKDFNFYQSVSTANTSYVSPPDVQITFKSSRQHLRFDIVSGSGTVTYSFNGSTDHGILTPSTSYNFVDFGIRNNKLIWFKTTTGTSVIRVEAFAIT